MGNVAADRVERNLFFTLLPENPGRADAKNEDFANACLGEILHECRALQNLNNFVDRIQVAYVRIPCSIGGGFETSARDSRKAA